MKRFLTGLLLISLGSNASFSLAQPRSIPPAPDRRPDEGMGPFERLIIRGAILIDGTGAPPIGPVDIVIEKNRIKEIVRVGYPGVPIQEERRPGNATYELDAHGMYVLPGFIDLHAHIGGVAQGTPAEYVFKLWMAHGITTIRDPGSGNGLAWTLEHKQRSAENRIVAPRIYAYVRFGQGAKTPLTTPEAARAWVRQVAQQGADGLKLPALPPDIMAATIDEARKLGLRTAAHLDQMGVARMDALDAARLGLTTLEHWYGLPEALFVDRTVQDFPVDYNYQNEQHRFGQAGRLWLQAAPPGSPKWEEVMEEFLRLDFTFCPTLTIYEASRDLMRAMRAEWHDRYTLPSLWKFFQPNRKAHGSYWFYWTTADEIAWKRNYQRWMQWLNEYKNRGGRVVTGSDSGFIFKLYGFGYIRELELLQEAGFHPLEVIRSATLYGAEALGNPEIGQVAPGKLADLIIVAENPLENFKVLYGTGWIRVNERNKVERTRGILYTIKDGIIYDAKQLLADVARMVEEAKRQEATSQNP